MQLKKALAKILSAAGFVAASFYIFGWAIDGARLIASNIGVEVLEVFGIFCILFNIALLFGNVWASKRQYDHVKNFLRQVNEK